MGEGELEEMDEPKRPWKLSETAEELKEENVRLSRIMDGVWAVIYSKEPLSAEEKVRLIREALRVRKSGNMIGARRSLT